jgi:hypothetical protein
MLKHGRSKNFLMAMWVLCPVTVGLYFGLVPELEAMRRPKVPGDLTFPEKRPVPERKDSGKTVVSSENSVLWDDSFDWLSENFEKLMAWDKNPWKRQREMFGSHFLKLKGSQDPADQAKVRRIEQLADSLFQQLLKRYPELAVEMRKVAPERNGFLRLLEFQERYNKPGQPFSAELPVPIPQSLAKLDASSWNAETARSWLDSQRSFLDEIRSIGLLPERSVADIDLDRWHFMSARFTKGCSDALLLDARLAAEDGDTARALASVRAVIGLADHLGDVETPTLLATTVQILVRMGTERYILSEVIPNLPAGTFDVSAWQNTLNPAPRNPDDFARVMSGEWNVCGRYYLMRPIADPEDPKSPSDPEALLDAYSGTFVEIVDLHRGQPLSRLPDLDFPSSPPDLSHLSWQSREAMFGLWVGAAAWRKGWDRAQSSSAMTLAAFSIMQGQALPNDPVYGLPYRWDPETRTLSAPDSPDFKEMDLKPIKVPKP